jgi:hypothetical protein
MLDVLIEIRDVQVLFVRQVIARAKPDVETLVVAFRRRDLRAEE